MPKRKLTGKIVSNKMTKTLVVETERIKKHPKYERRYKVNKKYKAHYESGVYNIGDTVVIEETKPISKDKKWIVIQKIEEKTKKEPEVKTEA